MSKSNFTNPFADVDIQPVTVAGQEVNKIAVRVKDDSGEYQTQGFLSKDYNLLKNSRIKEIGEDIFSRSPYKWNNLKTNWNGKTYTDFYHTEEVIETIENGGKVDLQLGCMLRNAYDGSGAYGMEFYILNPFCTNQYYARNQMGYFAFRHIGDNEINLQDAVDNISVGAQNLISLAPIIKELKSVPLKIEDITSAKKNTAIPTSKWGDVLDSLAVEEATRFGLFQALTFVSSHKLSGISSISVGNSITDHMLSL